MEKSVVGKVKGKVIPPLECQETDDLTFTNRESVARYILEESFAPQFDHN